MEIPGSGHPVVSGDPARKRPPQRCRDESDVVLVPDLLQQGTNVIALKPATCLPSCLGHEDSLARHHARARELGLSVSIQLSSGIAFDVDRPHDLERMRRR